jgi:hypothetical protein
MRRECGNCDFWEKPVDEFHIKQKIIVVHKGDCRESPRYLKKSGAEWCGRFTPRNKR